MRFHRCVVRPRSQIPFQDYWREGAPWFEFNCRANRITCGQAKQAPAKAFEAFHTIRSSRLCATSRERHQRRIECVIRGMDFVDQHPTLVSYPDTEIILLFLDRDARPVLADDLEANHFRIEPDFDDFKCLSRLYGDGAEDGVRFLDRVAGDFVGGRQAARRVAIVPLVSGAAQPRRVSCMCSAFS
jgi:hypothetical protein